MFGRSTRRLVAPAIVVVFALSPVTIGVRAAGPVAGTTGYQPYFGDLHTHTGYSDGARGTTPADAFAAAAAAGADFLATTDHHGSLTTSEWAATQAAAAAATTDSFVGLAGYEAWVTGIGEMNVYGTGAWPKHPTGAGADKANSGHHANRWFTLPSLYDWLASEPGAVGQWNHPTAYAGVSSEDFVGYAYWNPSRDDGVGLIEVFNDIVYEASYVRALDAGWHVMPSANSDTHAADWISGSEVRTVLLAASLTPASLLEAMRAGRGYATLDRNLLVSFTVNGEPMGSVLDGSTNSFSVDVRVEDPDAGPEEVITRVDVVADGGVVVASTSGADTTLAWETTLASATARYVFVRVWTASGPDGAPGPTAWTAPVWTGH